MTDGTGSGRVRAMVAAQRRAQVVRLGLAAACAAAVSAAAVVLLGLSGWFITGAALAGAAGTAAVQAFNYLLPSALIRLLAIVRTAARYGERIAGHDAALLALARIRPQLFSAFAAGPPDRSLAMAAGEVGGRLVDDVDAVQTLFVRLSVPWGLGAGAVASIGLAALAGPMAAGVVASAMAGAVAVQAVLARRLTDPAGVALQQARGRLKARLASLEAAAPELRAYGLSGWARDEGLAAADAVDGAMVRLSVAGGWMTAATACVTGLAVAGVVGVSLAAPAPLVALAALAAATGVEAAAGLASAFRQSGAAREAVARLEALTTDPPPGAEDGAAPSGGLALAPGARLGVSGATGSGKTTLIERLVGLRPAIPGEWGGVDGRFAYAAQDVQILDATVGDNLRLARPDATDAELWQALDDAVLGDRVRADPLGLAAPTGPGGERLSGGERRRLGLARACLRDAEWLVLDEPTEGLDAPLEAEVLTRLDRRLAATGQGLILISHRPAPLRLCRRRVGVEGIGADGRVRVRDTPS